MNWGSSTLYTHYFWSHGLNFYLVFIFPPSCNSSFTREGVLLLNFLYQVSVIWIVWFFNYYYLFYCPSSFPHRPSLFVMNHIVYFVDHFDSSSIHFLCHIFSISFLRSFFIFCLIKCSQIFNSCYVILYLWCFLFICMLYWNLNTWNWLLLTVTKKPQFRHVEVRHILLCWKLCLFGLARFITTKFSLVSSTSSTFKPTARHVGAWSCSKYITSFGNDGQYIDQRAREIG